MLMPAHSFVNTALILLNHVIRYAALASKFGDNRKVRIFVLCFWLSCNSWGIKFSQFPSCIYLC